MFEDEKNDNLQNTAQKRGASERYDINQIAETAQQNGCIVIH